MDKNDMYSLNEKIEKIMRQTNYDYNKAIEKFEEYNFNEINVIKDYMGIKINKKNTIEPSFINQEIYKQLRQFMDNSMKEFREKTNNINESNK